MTPNLSLPFQLPRTTSDLLDDAIVQVLSCNTHRGWMESYRGSRARADRHELRSALVAWCLCRQRLCLCGSPIVHTLANQPHSRRHTSSTTDSILVYTIITTNSLPSKHHAGSPSLRFSASYFTDLCTPRLPSPAALHHLSDEYFLFLFIPTLSLPCIQPLHPIFPLRARRNSFTTHDMTSPQRHSIPLYCFVYANLPEPLVHTSCII